MGSEEQEAVKVPPNWVNFFCATLMNPEKFGWAKSFLLSSMWQIMCEGVDPETAFSFFIPENFPVSGIPQCLQVFDSEDDNSISTPQQEPNMEKLLSAKRKDRGPVVESEVRRSTRLQQLNKGYKHKTCQHVNCMACQAKPPVCSSKVIRNLNTSYCKVAPRLMQSFRRRSSRREGSNRSGRIRRSVSASLYLEIFLPSS